MTNPSKRRPGWRRLRRWARKSAQNALELARLGRLAPADGLAFEVVDRNTHCRLRRYVAAAASPGSEPLVLIPPLMLTAEIYDVAPDLSAARMLVDAGIDTWVIDFGAPEREEGGMERTLDDHVRAVAWAVERVVALTGHKVHLAGYSQGGMFAYQAAAYLRGAGLASLITFGSPVDIHKNVANVASDFAGRFMRAIQPMLELPLDRIEGLPGTLSSTGFKLLTPRKELEQLADFVRKLHNRDALKKRESRRRFLGGEGFVAWPGPALRRFVDEFIVHNRMVSGGIVVDGRTLTLADIRCPILYFLGDRDDFARPASVQAIEKAAPHAPHYPITLSAGHFGLVVGSTSLRDTWPSVIAWVRWCEGKGELPELLGAPASVRRYNDEPEEYFEVDFDYKLLTDELAENLLGRWRQIEDVFRDAGEALDNLRWRVPRLARLERMTGATKVSPSLTLAQQARALGKETFFLWRGRAFSYVDADRRVSHVTKGLISCGIQPGDRVGVLMEVRPSYLSMVTALNRLGAIAVLLKPTLSDERFADALQAVPLRALATDPEHAGRGRTHFDGPVLVLGGGGGARQLPAEVVDMEGIDPNAVELPSWYQADAGRARDLALIFVRPEKDGATTVARVSNGRWAFSALGVASAATLSPADTIYCCLPLHHPTGLLVSVGGALMGGARLALSECFDVAQFWPEVRRYGATIVFYAGEMCRPLVDAAPSAGERNHPVRLFAGSGMRADVWRRLHERFGVGVLEFYASTERNLVLANASGAKQGALGRPLPGSAEMAIVQYDFEAADFVKRRGRWKRCDPNQPGVVIARVGPHVPGDSIRTNVFRTGDRWFVTGDVLRRDIDGDYWFVDRLANMVRTPSGAVGTPKVEDALYQLPEIQLAVVFAGAKKELVAVVRARQELDPKRLSVRLCERLAPHERPRVVFRVDQIPMTDGFRPIKAKLRAAALSDAAPETDGPKTAGPEAIGVLQVLRYQPDEPGYR